MDPFLQLLKNMAELLKDPATRKLIAAMAATWLISMLVTNAVTAMRRPDDSSTGAYRYWFTFLNGCVGSWKRIETKLHIPGADDQDDNKKVG